MNTGLIRVFRGLALARGALLIAVAGGLVGCGSESPEVASAPETPAVQGEPIRGEAIVAPTPVPSPMPSPATASAKETTPAVAIVSEPGSQSVPAVDAVDPGARSANEDAATVPAVVAAEAKSVGTPESPLVVGFDRLSGFKYDLPEGPVDTNAVSKAAASQIPESIRALNSQFIALKGYMLPLKVEKGLVTEMLILRDQSMCCYGAVPRINEWVSVKMVNTGAKPVMDQAVTLYGRLKVGEMYENGYLVGIYALDGDRIAGPLDM